jgi:hypothetical protein
VLIAEIHVVALGGNLIYLEEFIHVELSDEGGEMLVAEEVRQHLLLKLLP